MTYPMHITVLVDVAYKHNHSVGGMLFVNGKINICWEEYLSISSSATYAEV